jgi:hypothetical protein
MDALIRVTLDLNEKANNKYQLVYDVANLAKKLVEEQQVKKQHEEFGYEEASFNNSLKKEKPVQQAIMVRASESDDSGLVG